MRYGVDTGFGRQVQAFGETVLGLPIEIVARHIKQDLRLSVRENGFVMKRFPAHVHVRRHRQ